MDKRITQLVNQVKSHLIERYGDNIKEIILYGSHASINPSDVGRSLSDLLFDILLEKGELISVVVLPKTFFENYKFHRKIREISKNSRTSP
ncbi:MAG: hypothetical protein OCU16_05715 [Candidatus Methanospirare jalkutatii]|nr:hypothetical protein [Candidatus Methanospirare jalkutatii]